MTLAYVSDEQAKKWTKELPVKADGIRAELVKALEANGHAVVTHGPGYLEVDGVNLFSDNFKLDLMRVSWSQKPTGKLFYKLSTGYHRLGTQFKVYPEPKAGFDMAKMLERVEDTVKHMKRADEAREDHKKRVKAAGVVRDRVCEHMKGLSAGVDHLVKSVDSDNASPERVLVTLHLSERQAVALMRAIKLGELGDD